MSESYLDSERLIRLTPKERIVARTKQGIANLGMATLGLVAAKNGIGIIEDAYDFIVSQDGSITETALTTVYTLSAGIGSLFCHFTAVECSPATIEENRRVDRAFDNVMSQFGNTTN